MKQLRNGLYAIRGWFGWVHLLVDQDQVTLIDTGFIGDIRRIQRAILALGRKPSDLRWILLTHGHVDHTSNVHRLQQWSGANVLAPTGDELHLQGCYPYRGLTRICGMLEVCGRFLMRYQTPVVDAWLKGGDELPIWGGLQVIALPGHTAGHVGYWSPSKRVFFVGDLVAVSWRIALPPRFFNTDHRRLVKSVKQAATIDAEWVVPTHYFKITQADVLRLKCKANSMKRNG